MSQIVSDNCANVIPRPSSGVPSDLAAAKPTAAASAKNYGLVRVSSAATTEPATAAPAKKYGLIRILILQSLQCLLQQNLRRQHLAKYMDCFIFQFNPRTPLRPAAARPAVTEFINKYDLVRVLNFGLLDIPFK